MHGTRKNVSRKKYDFVVNILIGFNLSLNIMIGCPALSKILLHFLLFTKIPLINFIIAACTHATLSTVAARHSYRRNFRVSLQTALIYEYGKVNDNHLLL